MKGRKRKVRKVRKVRKASTCLQPGPGPRGLPVCCRQAEPLTSLHVCMLYVCTCTLFCGSGTRRLRNAPAKRLQCTLYLYYGTLRLLRFCRIRPALRRNQYHLVSSPSHFSLLPTSDGYMYSSQSGHDGWLVLLPARVLQATIPCWCPLPCPVLF